jgi:hypothetical protein
MSLVITVSMILMVVVIGAGFYRSAHAPAISGQQHASMWFVGVFLAAWLLLAVTLGAQGFFVTVRNPAARLPTIAYALIPLVVGYAVFRVVPALRETVERTPPQWLIGVQVWRVLGVVFLIGYAQGQLPGVFALPAGIGDVAIGLAAPAVAVLVRTRHPWSHPLAVLWNIAGLADLVLAVTLGVLSSPGPFHRLALDHPNRMISAYPFVLIPTVGVPLSILLHLFSLRGLRHARAGSRHNRSG